MAEVSGGGGFADVVQGTETQESAELEDLGSGSESGTESMTSLLSAYSSEESSDEEALDETLASTIIKEINEGTYTCLVCTGEIDNSSKVWSCAECFRVYDIDCIRSWALRGSSTDKTTKKWRCPACNTQTSIIPSKFTCWCGKVRNPTKFDDIPFSCGEGCNFSYRDCIHSCSSICHPGNHPTCGAMGPLMKCNCGKEERSLPCLITPYESGWKCENDCLIDICPFGHKCPKKCHLGFCGPCEYLWDAKCYCGKESIQIKCNDATPKNCGDWIGMGQCEQSTNVYYDCGSHFETVSCMPMMSDKKTCKYSPKLVDSCHCGKMKIDRSYRTSCTDPIPTCDAICGKTLSCGCTCLAQCHEGDCVCYNIKEVKCSCGNYEYLVLCKFIRDGFKPRCNHKCPVLLNCRRHAHKEVCCEYEQVALKRERLKKKAIRNNIRATFDDEIMSIEPVHICTQVCNRLKTCKMHYCDALCHPGQCPVCLESSSDDLVCHCGKTIIPAPVRCGTKINCQEQCVREKACGHRLEVHNCHDDSVSCPRCTFLMKKPCRCGLNPEVPNVFCSQSEASCGISCNKPRSCGHPCKRVCSPDCTKKDIHEPASTCKSVCDKLRSSCPHKCTLVCHANKTTKSKSCDNYKCQEKVSIQCDCGLLSKLVPCGASTDAESDIGSTFPCLEKCSKQQRLKQLESAFGSKLTTDDIPYTNLVMDIFVKQMTWCSRIEQELKRFVGQYEESRKVAKMNEEAESERINERVEAGSQAMESKEIEDLLEEKLGERSEEKLGVKLDKPLEASSEESLEEEMDEKVEEKVEKKPRNEPKPLRRLLRYPPMNKLQRAFIHDLAKSFGLYSESQDKEPKRSVFLMITAKCSQPLLSINEAVILRRRLSESPDAQTGEEEESYFNAIVLEDVFFGISDKEIKLQLYPMFTSSKFDNLEVKTLKESKVIIYPEDRYQEISVEEENQLYLLTKGVRKSVREKSLAFDCKLCLIDKAANYILLIDSKVSKERAPEERPTTPSQNSFSLLDDVTD